MTEENKIIEGLKDAVAYAKGDNFKGRSTKYYVADGETYVAESPSGKATDFDSVTGGSIPPSASNELSFNHRDIMKAVMRGCRSPHSEPEQCSETTQLFLFDVADAVMIEIPHRPRVKL